MKKNKLIIEKEPPTQPKQCIGCVWGKWTEVKQVCGFPLCFKKVIR